MPPNNSFFSCLSDACNKVKQYALDALSYLNGTKNARDETLQAENNALKYKNSAETAKNEAINAKNEAQNIADNIVIPNEATYNKDSIDYMLNIYLTDITALQAQISILKKGENNG